MRLNSFPAPRFPEPENRVASSALRHSSKALGFQGRPAAQLLATPSGSTHPDWSWDLWSMARESLERTLFRPFDAGRRSLSECVSSCLMMDGCDVPTPRCPLGSV